MTVAVVAALAAGTLGLTRAATQTGRPDTPTLVLRMEGACLRAMLASAEALKSLRELQVGQRNISNYRIELSEGAAIYEVRFVPHSAPHERNVVGGETSLGKEVLFTVRKSDFEVIDYVFFE